MKIRIASGIVFATWRAPWTSISSTTDAPSAGPLLELGAQRPVAAAGVLGVLEEVALDHAAVELDIVEEVVVRAVLLARARRPGGRGDGRARARGTRSSSVRMSVPFPTPEGPVITKTFPGTVSGGG